MEGVTDIEFIGVRLSCRRSWRRQRYDKPKHMLDVSSATSWEDVAKRPPSDAVIAHGGLRVTKYLSRRRMHRQSPGTDIWSAARSASASVRGSRRAARGRESR